MVRTCRTEGQSRSGALASQATAPDAWHTEHTPTILGFDEQIGALLIQAIEPGTPPDVSWVYPTADGIAELLNGRHADTAHRFHPGSASPTRSTPRRSSTNVTGTARRWSHHGSTSAGAGGRETQIWSRTAVNPGHRGTPSRSITTRCHRHVRRSA